MVVSTTQPAGLREMTRQAVRQQVSSRALALFAEQGFDETTIDEVAKAAGISPRSFFRYFATKEDLIVGDQAALGAVLIEALASRPTNEDPWVSLEMAMRALLETMRDDPVAGLRGSKLVMSTASLRARHLEKRLAWEDGLVPLIVARLGQDDELVDLQAHALVSSALACLDAAVNEWARRDGRETLSAMLHSAMRSVRRGD